jgi:organic hydroperoxide reductase OsmC/OhrA
MSEHRATIDWKRGAAPFAYESYPRDHTWTFEGGISVAASAAPAYQGNPDLVDPEEAFVASVSSCHMLTFLAVAAKRKLVVDRYVDEAVGVLEKNDEGRLAITKIALHPEVTFAPDAAPTPEQLAQIHASAHRNCFIANSVRSEVRVEPATNHARA